jgi:hypothetical protein
MAFRYANECEGGHKLPDDGGPCRTCGATQHENCGRPKVRSPEAGLALKAVIAHWDEFGPEHGFGEVIDRARSVLTKGKVLMPGIDEYMDDHGQ